MMKEPRPTRSTSFDLAGIEVSDKVVFLRELNKKYRIQRSSSLVGGFFTGLGALAVGGVILYVGHSVVTWVRELIGDVEKFSLVEYLKEWFAKFFSKEDEEEADADLEPPMISVPPPTPEAVPKASESEGAPPKKEPEKQVPKAATKPSKAKPADTAIRWYNEGSFGVAGIPEAVSYASRLTGVNSSVLYAFAFKESRFGKIMSSRTTSARGVFQLLAATYEDIKTRYADKYPILKAGVHNLKASAVAAALMIRELSQSYRRRFKTTPSVTDLYVMYLLGPGKGLLFLKTMYDKPRTLAVNLFESAARHNRSVFYDKEGSPRSLFQVYRYLHHEVGEVASKFSFIDSSPKVQKVDSENQRVPTVRVQTERVLPVDYRSKDTVSEFKVRFDPAPRTTEPGNSDSSSSRQDNRESQPQAFIRQGGMTFAV